MAVSLQGNAVKIKTLLGIIILPLFCLTFFSACGGGGGGGQSPASEAKKWTYMVYMGADNNLSMAGLNDLNEMEAAGSNADINIVVQAEFSTSYTDFAVLGHDWYQGETLRLLVEADNDPNSVNLEAGTSIGNVDMGSPAALTDFITWTVANYPAEHYALVIWDHGAGWKDVRLNAPGFLRGAVQDSTSNSFMSLPDLAKGVADAGLAADRAGSGLDIINFDACLMAMYEVAYEFKGLCDYLVSSEETEPGDGDPYDAILQALADSPGMSALNLASTIVTRYKNYYETTGRNTDITKSVLDMSALDSLDLAVRALSDAIIAEHANISGVITAAQNNTQSYAYRANHDLYDFCSYLKANVGAGGTLTAAASQQVMDALQSMVAANEVMGTEVADSHGIAIYAPRSSQIDNDEYNSYALLACNQSRAGGTWLDAVTAIIGGAPGANQTPGRFAFKITWDTDSDLDLIVIEPDGEPYSPFLGTTSPNGYFSGDSADTGLSEEYYLADVTVQKGRYDVVVNYYADKTDNCANVKFYWIDPDNSVTGWQESGPVAMDLSNKYNGAYLPSNLNDLNSYSDWWYAGTMQRDGLTDTFGPLAGDSGRRPIKLSFRIQKQTP